MYKLSHTEFLVVRFFDTYYVQCIFLTTDYIASVWEVFSEYLLIRGPLQQGFISLYSLTVKQTQWRNLIVNTILDLRRASSGTLWNSIVRSIQFARSILDYFLFCALVFPPRRHFEMNHELGLSRWWYSLTTVHDGKMVIPSFTMTMAW